MPLTITQLGSEIATEKLVLKAVTDAPAGQVLSVIMDIYINDTVIAHTLEHLPDLGTNNTFSFEINSIVKDYFASEFLPLTGVNQTVIENAIVNASFREVEITGVQAPIYSYDLVVKNMTQDTFEIEAFNLADYDCGDAGTTSSKLLTSSPNPLPIGDKTSVFVSCLTTSYDGGLAPKQEWVIQTLLNGVLVNTTTEAVTVPTRDLSPFVIAGKYDIANYRFDFDSSTGIDEVRFYIRDIASPFTSRSETRVFKINDACERSITLSWLNEYGVFDTFTFLGNITRVGKYTDSTFKRTRPVEPLSTDVGDLVYKSSYNYEYDIFSDRMPELAVKWLSKILINKRAAIQTEKEDANLNGLLYNWFVVDAGGGGDGTANGGIVNQSQTGWRVPSSAGVGGVDFSNLIAFLGAGGGGKLKQTGLENWNTPNTGATNVTGFNGIGSGRRDPIAGSPFSNVKNTLELITHANTLNPSLPAGSYTRYIISFNGDGIGSGVQDGKAGASIRLIRDAVGGENDGDFIPNAYEGNNGEKYDGVVIGAQVWITRNLYETKLNDGTDIPNVKDGTTWLGLTTGAYSVYDNATLQATTFSKYFPIVITTEETVLDDKFTPETLFRLKFRLANRRKGLK